jgi:1,4-alpha-glucan branching enzyme
MRGIRTTTPKAVLAVVLLAAASALSSCAGVLNAIEDRLPPPHEVAGGILFNYYAPSSRQVTLAGSFNNWGGTQGGGRYDASIDPMSDPEGDGVWSIVLPLPPGRYQYKFVLDGGVRWEQDPNNADKASDSGIENSLVIVPPGVRYATEAVTGTGVSGTELPAAETTATAAVPVTFELTAPDAAAVSVAGVFNAWDPNANPLAKGADGIFRATVAIAPGSYEYKFVVDGTWMEDPANPDAVPDPYGGKNSVLTVK